MKHFYRNLICISLILVAVAGIVLMSLNFAGILTDNLIDPTGTVYTGGDYDDFLTDELSKRVILTYDSDYTGLVYFRSQSKGNYNERTNTFKDASVYRTNSLNPRYYYVEKAKESQTPSYHINVDVQVSLSNRKITPDYSFYGLEGDTKVNDCYSMAYGSKTYSYETEIYPEPDESRFEPSFIDVSVANEELNYRKFVYENYLSISNKQKETLLAFMDKEGLNPKSPTLTDDLVKFFNAKYVTGLLKNPISKGNDPIMYFLEESKQGLYNNFTSATVLLLRSSGIPARFVSGYLDYSFGGKTGVIKGVNLYTWTEYYIDGEGWCRLDTTSLNIDPESASSLPFANMDKESQEEEGKDSSSGSEEKESSIDSSKDSSESSSDSTSGHEEYGEGNGQGMDSQGGLSSSIYSGGPDERSQDPVFSYSCPGYAGPLYFRSRSVGDYNYMQGSFTEANPYTSYSTVNPRYYGYHASVSDNQPSYTITYSPYLSDSSALIPDYSNPFASLYSGNDCYESYPSQDKTEYWSNFYPETVGLNPVERPWSNEELAYRQFVKQNYLNVPDEMRETLFAFLTENDITNPEDAPFLIRNLFITDYQYGFVNAKAPSNEDPLLYFLLTRKTGICSNFASSTVLLLRTLGVPARMVLGFTSSSDGTDYQKTVTASNAHAWTEYYVDGLGWVRLDTTPSSGDAGKDENPLYTLYFEPYVTTYDGTEKSAPNGNEYFASHTRFVNNLTQEETSFQKVIGASKTCNVKAQLPPVAQSYMEADRYPMKITIQITDSSGNDVTKNFSSLISVCCDTDAWGGWTCPIGSFSTQSPKAKLFVIEKRKITFASADLMKEYDGSPFDKSMFADPLIQSGSLASGDTITYTYSNENLSFETNLENVFTVRIYHDGVDVTDSYDIQYSYGSFIIYS